MKRRMVRVEAERRREEARRAERSAAESSSAAAKYNRPKSRRRRLERRPSIMKIENVSGFLLIVKSRGGWLVYNVGDYLFVFLYINPFVFDQVCLRAPCDPSMVVRRQSIIDESCTHKVRK